eukprot:228255_1
MLSNTLLFLCCIILKSTLGINEANRGVMNRLSESTNGRKLLQQALGESCSVNTDCNNNGQGATQNACCLDVCTQKVPDWAGVGYCPHVCTGAPGASPGTCPLKQDGESCSIYKDCADKCCING